MSKNRISSDKTPSSEADYKDSGERQHGDNGEV
jgi:hypothetical protein